MRTVGRIVLVVLLLAGATTVYAQATYLGSTVCKACHSTSYNDVMKSGHPYKLTKVTGGTAPTYPFSEVPNPPEGYTWADLTYVIGGYGWKARFLDQNGYIVTGDAVQYNLATKGWSGYHASEAPGTKPYDCGACHTTGWQTLEENGGVHQDGLEGISGTWAEPGVTCEACHGPGSAHVAGGGDKTKIVKDTSSELCGRCHYRDQEHRIAASGGFIQHHEQYDELVNSPHRVLTCGTCHAPHKSTKYAQGGVKGTLTCTTCHADQTVKIRPADHSCASCHMPLASKSAVTTGPEGVLGDIHSHTFRLNTDPEAQMFTEDGQFVQLDADGNAIVKVEFACQGCHNGEVAKKQSVKWMYANAAIVHTGGEIAVEEEASRYVPGVYALHPNYPNPFNAETTIVYALPEAGMVELIVFNNAGQPIRTLQAERQAAGFHTLRWDGRDAAGRSVASGIYLYRLKVGNFEQTQKMVLLR